MKNLKKVLSLGLASSMLMGMMVVGAGAATYTDADEINNTQAVEIMSAVGVFSGTDAGDFKPQGDLTRETAAKIITYMLMGKTAADKLSTTAAPFKDVAANRWSAGSIAYCVNMGIIAGDGAGNFYPTQTVNGYAFAKMLLVALGYDAKVEGFTGSNWAINVSKTALKVELDAGMDISLSNTMTREQACQMAFNAIEADMVEYANKGTEITTSDGTTIVVGASPAAAVANNKGDYRTGSTDTVMQFCERYMKDLKVSDDTDNLNRPAETWTYANAEIGTYAKAAAFTYTTAVTAEDLEKTLKNYTIAAQKSYTDGVAALTNDITDAASIADKTGNGVVVEIFADADKNITNVCVTNSHIGEVVNVDEDKDGDRYIEIDGVSAKLYTEQFAEGDMVVYTLGKDSNGTVILTADEAESASGTLTAYTVNKKLTVGGSTYDFSANNTTDITGFAIKDEVTVYFDRYGYVILVETVKSASVNYAYVAAAANNFGDISAKLVFADGTTAVVDTDATNTSDIQGKLVTYTVSGKDVYHLTVVAAAAADQNVTIVNNKVGFTTTAGSYTANSKTVFVIKTGSSYKTYTGYANVPNVTVADSSATAAVYCKSGTVANFVYLEVDAGAVSDSSTSKVFIAYNASATATTDEKGTYYTYNAVVDGKITTLNVKVGSEADESLTGNMLISSVSYDKDGLVTKIVEADADVAAGTLVGKAENNVVTINGDSATAYGYSDNMVVYKVNSKAEITKSTVSALKDGTSVVATISKDLIEAVYIVG